MRLTFRQKLLLTYAACALLLVFATFVSASYYINSLQKSNVREAIVLAREQAEAMAQFAQEILATRGPEGLKDPDVQKDLRAVTEINLRSNKNLLWTAFISPDGDRLIQEFGDNPKDSHIQRDESATDISKLELPNGYNIEVEVSAKRMDSADVKVPIKLEGSKPAHIEMKIVRSDTFHRIEAGSQSITRTLIFGCLLMLLFLLGVYVILYRMFFKHLDLQEKNSRLDRMAYVGTLASGLAHEIRNPLSAMNVNLEVIREELLESNPDESSHTLELSQRVQREVLQLNNTLTNFLDFALPRKEGYSQFALAGLVDELVESHAEQLKASDVTVEVDMPGKQQTVIEADRHLLHQALRNILVNAIHALGSSIKKNLTIAIKLLPKDRILLSITDSGPGIPQENLAKIFEVFYSTKKGGSGFGLAIARKIVEEHSGKLWVENNRDTKGVTFFVNLPMFAVTDRGVSEDFVFTTWNRKLVGKDDAV